ncbi:hypothetical protein Droror1_Dr00025879 [Drosera rotundifolia]
MRRSLTSILKGEGGEGGGGGCWWCFLGGDWVMPVTLSGWSSRGGEVVVEGQGRSRRERGDSLLRVVVGTWWLFSVQGFCIGGSGIYRRWCWDLSVVVWLGVLFRVKNILFGVNKYGCSWHHYVVIELET